MTRDRFIKLLMASGVQINQARAIAFRYNARKIPYRKAYSEYLALHKMRRAFSRFVEAAVKLGNSFRVISTAFEKYNHNSPLSQTK